MPCLLIGDGFTLDFALAARGPWPAVKGRYRPALPEEVHEYLLQKGRAATGKDAVRAGVKLLAAHLEGWDVLDARGEVVAMTEANLAKLPPPYFSELIDVVTGYGAQAEGDLKNS